MIALVIIILIIVSFILGVWAGNQDHKMSRDDIARASGGWGGYDDDEECSSDQGG